MMQCAYVEVLKREKVKQTNKSVEIDSTMHLACY